jgi:hypothetical protein
MGPEEIADSMYAGVRRAQDICFCRDWTLFKTVDVSDNPFGFSKKKLLEKAMSASGYSAVEEQTAPMGSMPLNEWGEPEYDEEPSVQIAASAYHVGVAVIFRILVVTQQCRFHSSIGTKDGV